MRRFLAAGFWALGALTGVGCSADPFSDTSRPSQALSPSPAPALSRPPPGLPPRPVAPPITAPNPATGSSTDPPEAAPEPSASAPEPAERALDATIEPDPGPLLIAVQREVFVYERPSFASRKLGYLRAGARVQRGAAPEAFERCAKGFYRVRPEGFVCAGGAAALDRDTAVSELGRLRPDRLAALPYVYARARNATPPLYVKLPSALEQARVEPEASALGRRATSGFDEIPSSPLPARLAAGGLLPTPFGGAHDPSAIATGRALLDSGFALLGVYDHGGRRFGLTSSFVLVPLDRLERVTPSAFHGVSLEGAGLPVAFVLRRGASLYAGSPESGLAPARPLAYREAVPLSGRRARIGGLAYLEAASGEWLRDERLVRIDPDPTPPRWASGERRWLHVSIGKQTLVAYAGARPVYATLVSTGADGLGDPETTRSTPRGEFLVHTKHVSAAMRGDEVGDEYDLDVPYVQYFSADFALHAAYWHDGFGAPRSHGCVNLSPLDARFLFHWTDPPVPQLWHGAFSLREGTLVHVTP